VEEPRAAVHGAKLVPEGNRVMEVGASSGRCWWRELWRTLVSSCGGRQRWDVASGG
jgi:hypothetical protein